MGTSPLNRLRVERYTMLLVLLLVLVALQTSTYWSTAVSGLVIATRVVMGVAILVVIFEQNQHRLVMGGVLLGALAGAGADALLGGTAGRLGAVAFHIFEATLLVTALVWILRRLLRSRSSGGADVLGAICGYLLAGEALISINALVYLLEPHAYNINTELSSLIGTVHGRISVFTYYSFSQLLTLGDPDVTPVRAPATTLSLFAALFGVFYTAIVVAQFVGLEGGASRRDEAP